MPSAFPMRRVTRLLPLLGMLACGDASTSPTRVVPRPPQDTMPATAAPAWFFLVSGDGQTALAGQALPSPVRLLLTDALNRPLIGRPVRFDLTDGGGRVSDTLVVTDANGIATLAQWTMGEAGTPQRVRARSGAAQRVVHAFATGLTPAASAGRYLYMTGNRLVDQRPGAAPIERTVTGAWYTVSASPDLSAIAFTSETATEACVLTLASGERRCASRTQLGSYGNFANFGWSRDGTRVLLDGMTYQPCNGGICWSGRPLPIMLSPAAMQLTTLPESPGLRVAHGADNLSPDGRQLAYAIDGELWVMQVDGSDRRKVTVPGIAGSYRTMAVAWSPNGRWLALHLESLTDCPWSCDMYVAVVGVDGLGARLLATIQAADARGLQGRPIWSPDGTSIAYNLLDCGAPAGCTASALAATIEGGAPRLLTAGYLVAWR